MLKKIAIFSGVSLGIGVTAAAVYRFSRDWQKNVMSVGKTNSGSQKEDSIKLVVSKDRVGSLIGKRGATINKIREDTGARITLEGEDDQQAYLIVKGTKHERDSAVVEINKIIARAPAIVVEEIIYPYNTWPTILGTNGEKLRHLSQLSRAVVTVKGLGKKESFKLTIQGTREEVQYITSLVDEYLAHKEASQMNKPIGVVGKNKVDLNTSEKPEERLESLQGDNHRDGFTQVFVSAVRSPNDFWVQLYGPKSIELDKLCGEMMNFYNSPENRKSNVVDPSCLCVGFLLAALYYEDAQWYRARVTKVTEEPEKLSMVHVLFVDFGDYAVLEVEKLCKLKPEYLVLPLQAIHCSLHGIKPSGDCWTFEATEYFKDITYMALWKPLMTKIVEIEENQIQTPADIVNVILIDTNEAEDVDTAKELIKNGHAIEIKPQT